MSVRNWPGPVTALSVPALTPSIPALSPVLSQPCPSPAGGCGDEVSPPRGLAGGRWRPLWDGVPCWSQHSSVDEVWKCHGVQRRRSMHETVETYKTMRCVHLPCIYLNRPGEMWELLTCLPYWIQRAVCLHREARGLGDGGKTEVFTRWQQWNHSRTRGSPDSYAALAGVLQKGLCVRALDVTVSQSSIQVARGQAAVLPCSFTTSAALNNLNIIWMVIPLSNANQPEQVHRCSALNHSVVHTVPLTKLPENTRPNVSSMGV
ncbi:unnamed protein product [Arctogadus glacialis]